MASGRPILPLTKSLVYGTGYRGNLPFIELFSMPTIEPTIQDVIDVLHTFSRQVDQRFDRLETRIEVIEKTMVTKDYFEERLHPIEARLTLLEQNMGLLEQNMALMVTKTYMDTRFASLEKHLSETVARLERKTWF